MKAFIGSDHAGIDGRNAVASVLENRGWEVHHIGPSAPDEKADYPDIAHDVATGVTSDDAEIGILVCGTGQGMAMTANKYPGVRAAVITDSFTAEMSRGHNDANIACFGERVLGTEKIAELLAIFLDTPFEGGRHGTRVNKIDRVTG
ncbi:ribose 5-phosphate isomerase B [bacterium TMED181]|nr:ribose 5-phosphate isomerase B [Planctomycetota bacterium]OUW43110.1 MAG: ribose 5-phosphate isomerase B [bacterium TMED181]